MTVSGNAGAPLILIANPHEWLLRSLESVFLPGQYRVLRAYTRQQALRRAGDSFPDVVLVNTDFPDGSGLEVCRALRDASPGEVPAPVFLTSNTPLARADRVAALRAGAWDVLFLPPDAEELLLRVETYARARGEANTVRRQSLLDPVTGAYNNRGVLRRAEEIGADAERNQRPFACVVLHVPWCGTSETGEQATVEKVRACTDALKRTGRRADVVGRVGSREWAVLASGTGSRGAERFALRMVDALRGIGDGDDQTSAEGVRGGWCAVENLRTAGVQPRDVLMGAATALRRSQVSGEAGRGVRLLGFPASEVQTP